MEHQLSIRLGMAALALAVSAATLPMSAQAQKPVVLRFAADFSPSNAFLRVPQPSFRAMRMNPQIRIGINMNVFSRVKAGSRIRSRGWCSKWRAWRM